MTEDHGLFEAIRRGEAAQVDRMLVEHPDLARARTPDGISAILYARYVHEPEIAEAIARRVPDLSVFEACALGNLRRVEELLQAQPDLANAYAPDGFQPLGLAAFFGHLELVGLLLARGAAVNSPSRNAQRVMPLHSAAAGAHLEIARLLIEHGADVNARQAGGFIPLHAAAQNGQLELVRLLVDRGARVDARAADGSTPEQLARERSHADVLALLREGTGSPR